MATRCLVLLTACAVLAGCSAGGGADDDGASLGETSPPILVTAPAAPPLSRPGTGVVVVGSTSSSFAVTECRLAPDPVATPAPAGTVPFLRVTGAGTTGGGVPFQIEVQRFATGDEVQTFTDTIAYTDSARILQAQRFEVAGEVTDLRDPDARSVLLRVRPDGVTATGLAGPPGSVQGEDEGIVGMALDVTCS